MPVIPSPGQGILAVLRAASGIVVDPWAVFVGVFTSDPDRQLTIRHIGGRAGEPSIAIDYPSIQLLCRGAPGGYDEAYQKIWAARQALVAIPSAPAAYAELTSCTMLGDMVDLGLDDLRRPVFSQNLQLIVSYDTSGYRT